MTAVEPRIDIPYLLICPIPHYVHADGSIWLDRLWHRDLLEHLAYLSNLTLLSPRSPWSPDADLVRLDPPAGVEFRVVAIPMLDSYSQALRRLPRVTATLWQTIAKAKIVHSGIAGWPIPIGWIANPIALIRRKRLLLVVESAPWRIPDGAKAGLRARVQEWVTERLGRFFVNRADLVLFTQPSYRESLLTTGNGKAYITPATWVNDGDIASEQSAAQAWQQEINRPTEGVRILFAGRLIADKGISVLLGAIRKLDADGVTLRVDVIGEGPLKQECISCSQSLTTVKMSVLSPVPYGAEFFELLRRYHAVVVPSLSDEQPRLVFDAFSQAVPVLASRTDGLSPYVIEGRTGRLFQPGDVDALAGALSAASDLTALRELGMNGLSVARTLTHREMHRTRRQIILDCFG